MIFFIIPVYNEEKNIADLLLNIKERSIKLGYNYRIIIINDGSTDNTESIIKSFNDNIPIQLHGYYPNRGVGKAFLQGFRIALSSAQEDDVIVTQEGDNTSDLSILPELITEINRGADMALASCYAPGGGIVGTNFYRLFLSKSANLLLKMFFPINGIRTFSSFYRAYRASSLRNIFYKYGDNLMKRNGYECMVELLIKLWRWGDFKTVEVPMLLDNMKRRDKSKMKSLKTIRGFLSVILREGILYKWRAPE